MSAPLLGISSSYFATRKLGIYDSVNRARELGFETVELGAAHKFEPKVWETVRKIRKNFCEMNFTVHGLFPPQNQSFWFNASHGLNTRNKRVLDNLFKSAELAGATVVGIHPGFLVEMGWGKSINGLNLPKAGKPIEKANALNGVRHVLAYASKLSKDVGIRFAIENITNTEGEALVYSSGDFAKIFDEFPEICLLLDVGHALFENNFQEFLELSDKVCEMHLHYSESKGNSMIEPHKAFPQNFDFTPLSAVRELTGIPLIFEHGNDVSEEELLREKQLVENFLKRQA